MYTYIFRRLALTVPSLVGVSLLVFAAVRFLPGDAVSMMLQDYGSYAKDANDLRARLGIDQPFHVQYVVWVDHLLHGDLGRSLRNNTPIVNELRARLPVTFELGLLGLAISLLIAVPLGVYSAVRQDSLSDYLARSVATVMLAVPGFWLATLAITLPSIWFGWTPPLRFTQFLDNPARNLNQMLLPAAILGIGLSGGIMRLTRAQMLEVLRQDHIRTARGKGLTEPPVLFRHALRNALIPIVTLVGLQITVLVSGTVVLESIFVIPGMGRYLLEAITYRDYPIVQAVVLIFAGLITITNLFVDMLYAWLDPRIRYEGAA